MATQSKTLDLLQVIDSVTSLTQKIKFPLRATVIENPSNTNEIFVIGAQQSSIFIYKKNEKACVPNKVD